MKKLRLPWTWMMLGAGSWGCAHAAEPTQAPDTIEARAQGCSTCHGAHGEGTAEAQFPRIAGKPAGYLFNQLKNFRDGQRSYPPMNYLVAYMNDDFLRELAGYFAAQPSRPPATPAASVLPASVEQSGREIATQGDAAHGVPACVLCHGKGLAGIEPGIPGLIGLDGRYIAAQLVSWRVGTRHAGAPDCMHQVAEHLTESQIRAVSSWLGTQTPADAARPAAHGTWTTPLACGSQP